MRDRNRKRERKNYGMFYTAEAAEKPRKVTIEKMPDGGKRVLLADNIKTKDQEEGGITYEYETVVFSLPDDRDETVKSITTNFADWWEYGKTPEETPTLAERVAILEELMLG